MQGGACCQWTMLNHLVTQNFLTTTPLTVGSKAYACVCMLLSNLIVVLSVKINKQMLIEFETFTITPLDSV